MTKEESIKEAWGEYYELIKDELDEHGRYNYYDCDPRVRKRRMWQFENIEMHQISNLNLLIPSSIKGIENNNGWIKIESEYDLPKEKGYYEVIWNDKNVIKYWFGKDNIYADLEKQNDDWIKQATHYAPTEKRKPPIF